MWILRIIVLQLFVFVLTDAAITVNMNVLMKDSQRHLLKRPEQFKPLQVPSADELKRFLPEIRELSIQVKQNNIAAVKQGIDTLNGNATAIFGPHLITDPMSIDISNDGFVFAEITKRALERAFSTTFPHTTRTTTTEIDASTTFPQSTRTTTTEIDASTTFPQTTTIPPTETHVSTTFSQTTTLPLKRVIDSRLLQKDPGNKLLTETNFLQVDDFLQKLPHPDSISLKCRFPNHLACNPLKKYRNIDGSCNNLENPTWGKSFTPFDRFLKPEYANVGSDEPRTQGKFGILPGARVVSNKVHTKSTAADLDPPLSYFTMQFGQFLDHDITKTALAKGSYHHNLDCCGSGRSFNPNCFPIDIPADDPYFERKCMNFVRSVPSQGSRCAFGFREQLNELTHWIDGSAVYGSTQAQLEELLDPAMNGKLKVSPGNLLPLDESNESGCILEPNEKCFRAGDVRANVQPGLSTLHTIWVREHNRIANHFLSMPECYNWTSEQIFEETRRYVAAEIQHITYNEFLLKLLSEDIRKTFDLVPLESGYYTGYDPTVRPMIRNSFATAAYRMGHSLLRDHLFHAGNSAHDLHEHFNKPSLVYANDGIEHCARGLYANKAQTIDEKMTTEVTWKLFETMAKIGGDLAAFNIQRGRDHGLPPYGRFLDFCTGIKMLPDNFNAGVKDGLFFHTQAKANQLKSVYSSTCDIDLFPGAMTETPLPGGRLGPTFTCILALQFKALKTGDRFYYEGNPPLNPHPFTPEELNGLRPITMAKIICQNTKIDKLPRDVFLEPSEYNPNISCSELSNICFPKNGGWGDWQRSCCSSCCKTEEFRKCDNPPPNECGKSCEGYDYRFKFSSLDACNCHAGCCNGCQ